jgi:hypothetical protein
VGECGALSLPTTPTKRLLFVCEWPEKGRKKKII